MPTKKPSKTRLASLAGFVHFGTPVAAGLRWFNQIVSYELHCAHVKSKSNSLINSETNSNHRWQNTDYHILKMRSMPAAPSNAPALPAWSRLALSNSWR